MNKGTCSTGASKKKGKLEQFKVLKMQLISNNFKGD